MFQVFNDLTRLMFTKLSVKIASLVTNKRFLSDFLLETGKSKDWFLNVLATYTVLASPEQEMTWIVGTSGEWDCNNTSFFNPLVEL